MGEFESINKAGLLVQAAEVTAEVDDLVLCFEVFARYGLNCNKYVTKVYLSDTSRHPFYLFHTHCVFHFEMLQKCEEVY